MTIQEGKPDCGNHKKDLFGHTDMKEVAEAIGDLHYETLTILITEIGNKIGEDERRDAKAGRKQLAAHLFIASEHLKSAAFDINKALEISKPFMKKEDNP